MKSLWSSRDAAPKEFLIIGLGNPGSSYEKTRHNVGFRAVRYFAERHRVRLKKSSLVSAELGHGPIYGAEVGIVLPLTYMNSSGEAVKESIAAFKVALKRMVVVVDDVALPFGVMRLKEGGSSGGHNGLKSIEEHVGTQEFPRLRIGIGSYGGAVLADYVLSQFDTSEEEQLPKIFEKAADVLDCWIRLGIQQAMTKANTEIGDIK